MEHVTIPPELLHFDLLAWHVPLPAGHETTGTPELRAREQWRRAQDTWAHAHGMDRQAFERLRDRQRRDANSDMRAKEGR